MTLEECRLLIPQYLSRELSPSETIVFEDQLQSSAELRAEVEELRPIWEKLALLPEEQPSPAMRAHFYQRLNALERNRGLARGTWFSSASHHLSARRWAQMAAAVLLFVAGMLTGRAHWGGSAGSGEASKQELAKMSSQVQNLRELVALSLLDRPSATSRLEGVEYSSRIDQPKEEVVGALVQALNHDTNVNVRLSSINALERFAKDAAVSKALVDSIEHQDSPLVQIALIDSLVSARNRSAASELKKLTVASDVNPSVRQRAQWGLDKLTFE